MAEAARQRIDGIMVLYGGIFSEQKARGSVESFAFVVVHCGSEPVADGRSVRMIRDGGNCYLLVVER